MSVWSAHLAWPRSWIQFPVLKEISQPQTVGEPLGPLVAIPESSNGKRGSQAACSPAGFQGCA